MGGSSSINWNYEGALTLEETMKTFNAYTIMKHCNEKTKSEFNYRAFITGYEPKKLKLGSDGKPRRLSFLEFTIKEIRKN